MPADALAADYRLLQKRLGTTRHVIIQPSAYGVDKSSLVYALGFFGPKEARAVAVVNTMGTGGRAIVCWRPKRRSAPVAWSSGN